MIDTVAISGGSNNAGGYNGDQYFSHMIEEYSEPRGGGASGLLWMLLFLFALIPLAWFGMQKMGGIDAIQKMISSGGSNPMISAEVVQIPRSTKTNPGKNTQQVRNGVPSMRIEMIPPGGLPAIPSIPTTVVQQTAKQIPTVPTVNMNQNIVVPVPVNQVPLVQIDRVQVAAQPDVGFDDLSLPAGIQKPSPGTLRVLSADTRSELQSMLGHRFSYKQYAAMERLRRLRLAGSEDLLRQGLKHRKFWTRMEALFGLAEIGAQLSPADLQTAIGTSRPFLQKSYFKRFQKGLWGGGMFYQGPNQAEKYILSLCMYFVGEPAQSVISQAIRT
jgi:hypothetical protein